MHMSIHRLYRFRPPHNDREAGSTARAAAMQKSDQLPQIIIVIINFNGDRDRYSNFLENFILIFMRCNKLYLDMIAHKIEFG